MTGGARAIRRKGRWRRAYRGQAIGWVAVMLPVFLLIIGLAIDGATVFAARRDAQNVADGAARAGAMEIDIALLRRSDGRLVRVDPPLAREEALRYLALQRWADATVIAEETGVTVTAGQTVELGLMRLAGFGSVRISATGRATPFSGIDQGQRP